MDTAKAVMLTLLMLGVLAFAAIIVWSTTSNTSVAQTSGTDSATNESVTSVTEVGDLLARGSRPDAVCTVTQARNASDYEVIQASNYTVTGCTIKYYGGAGGLGFNNTNWLVDYTETYNAFGEIEGNLTNGTAGFFSNTSTWFALLAVVVIILIIAIVVFAVNRFGGGKQGGL